MTPPKLPRWVYLLGAALLVTAGLLIGRCACRAPAQTVERVTRVVDATQSWLLNAALRAQVQRGAVVEPTIKNDKDTINLFDVGCLVNLSIGMWSGRKMITEEDLRKVGIDPTSLPKDIVNYGRKLLVPKSELKVMNNIQQRARVYLDKWSKSFGISSSHFVPVKMLPSVEQELKGLKEEFFAAVDSFVSRVEDMKNTIKDQYPDFQCIHASSETRGRGHKGPWRVTRVYGMERASVHGFRRFPVNSPGIRAQGDR